jgi:hypothetical protein
MTSGRLSNDNKPSLAGHRLVKGQPVFAPHMLGASCPHAVISMVD